MIVEGSSFFAISTSSGYPSDDTFPDWAGLRSIVYCPGQIQGYGAEPHYHDKDEFWFFTSGAKGVAWLGDVRYDVGPNAIVYTPMGVVHRFQMFGAFANVGVGTRLEGKRRNAHLDPVTDGAPVATGDGFVVPGDRNIGVIADRPARCPVREMRVIGIAPGSPLVVSRDTVTYVLSIRESVSVAVDGHPLVLTALQQSACAPYSVSQTPQGDLLLLQPGAEIMIEAAVPAEVVLIRE